LTPTAAGTQTPTFTSTAVSSPAPTSTSTPTVTGTLPGTPTPTGTAVSTNTATPASSSTPAETPSPFPAPTEVPEASFVDVPPTYWAFPYIEALYRAGYVVGCSASPRMYCPDRILIRSESAVFILRGAYGAIPEAPYPTPTAPTFADVSRSYWGFGWIESLWKDGYTAGCGTNPLIFCPQRNHTRAEGSVFFLRIQNGVSYNPPAPAGIFSDVSLTAWYAPWVEAAYNQGLLPACHSNPLRFCPEDALNRAWAAYMMTQAKGMGLPTVTPAP
jgi:hypothetical protein